MFTSQKVDCVFSLLENVLEQCPPRLKRSVMQVTFLKQAGKQPKIDSGNL